MPHSTHTQACSIKFAINFWSGFTQNTLQITAYTIYDKTYLLIVLQTIQRWRKQKKSARCHRGDLLPRLGKSGIIEIHESPIYHLTSSAISSAAVSGSNQVFSSILSSSSDSNLDRSVLRSLKVVGLRSRWLIAVIKQ